MEILLEALKFGLYMILGLVGFLMLLFIFVLFMSFVGIFVPLRWIYSGKHFDKCTLRHGHLTDGFWHFVDTRGNLMTFDSAHYAVKGSPNRPTYLRQKKEQLERNIAEGSDYGIGFVTYCRERLEEIEKEMNAPITKKR